ncbi:MAG: FdhF/YdeP family oxidoreductase [Chrysiogenetes bacterium]|nr:FdhF/YdeP family oxidoreductase [Chrysiogenetes bacterium]
MAKPAVRAAGGFRAIFYFVKKALSAGGLWKSWKRLRSNNACKTCALGMGGQAGGLVDEGGHFPSVCKKSIQVQAGDMAAAIPEGFFRFTSIEQMAGMSPAQLEAQGRLAFPIIAEPGDRYYRPISWEEAYDKTAAALRAAPPEEAFFYASGRSSNEAAFLFQLFARAYGSANIHNCSYYCHQASGVALSKIYGSGTASVVLEDLHKADFVMVIGANPPSNHPRLITQLMQLRRRGGKVLVVNPLKELGLQRFRVPSDWRSLLFGSSIANLYIQPHIGADIALLKAILKGVIEGGGVDEQFVSEHATGWAEVEADARAQNADQLAEAAGVPRAQIDQAVEMILSAKRGIFCWAMGITHHAHGVDNILELANLAMARGWLGREGAGLLPIRGHSNVQGVGSVGVAPALKAAFAEQMEARYGITVPAESGQDTYASMMAALEGRIRVSVQLGGNLYHSNPDADWAARALQNIPLTFQVSTQLNTGHAHGRGKTTIVVPALVRDEETQLTMQESMFNFVRISDGGQEAPEGEPRSEVDIIASLAERVLPERRFDWSELRSHEALRKAIGAVVPGYQPAGNVDPERKEFQVVGRTFHAPRFGTEDGKARFHVTQVPEYSRGPDEYQLMTIRSEGQFNTVVYEEEDLYRGNTTRDVVMMSAEDAERNGWSEGERVRVTTEVGSMSASVAITDIRAGNLAMYFPEANCLVPRKLDALSKTPAFKSVQARLESESGRQSEPVAEAG